MISKDFSAPTGSGIRRLLVAPEALAAVAGTNRRITVIVAHHVVGEVNWERALPNATYLTAQAWMRRAKDADTDLIIVDELTTLQRALVTSTLERIAAEVWTVNHKPHNAPVFRVTAGIAPPDFEGWGPLAMAEAQGFDVADLKRPAATIITDSAPCAGVSKPMKPRNWSLEPRDTKLVKRARALASSDIKKIDVAGLDALLAPYMHAGLLRTTYERCTGATEYRGSSGSVIAVSIGEHHFARRSTPLALYMQHVGRIKRHMPPTPLHADGRELPDMPISGPTIKGMIDVGWLSPIPADGPAQ